LTSIGFLLCFIIWHPNHLYIGHLRRSLGPTFHSYSPLHAACLLMRVLTRRLSLWMRLTSWINSMNYNNFALVFRHNSNLFMVPHFYRLISLQDVNWHISILWSHIFIVWNTEGKTYLAHQSGQLIKSYFRRFEQTQKVAFFQFYLLIFICQTKKCTVFLQMTTLLRKCRFQMLPKKKI
jgi:hypothetical protein